MSAQLQTPSLLLTLGMCRLFWQQSDGHRVSQQHSGALREADTHNPTLLLQLNTAVLQRLATRFKMLRWPNHEGQACLFLPLASLSGPATALLHRSHQHHLTWLQRHILSSRAARYVTCPGGYAAAAVLPPSPVVSLRSSSGADRVGRHFQWRRVTKCFYSSSALQYCT